MSTPLAKRLQALFSVLSVLLLLVLLALVGGYFLMRGSLAQLDGQRVVSGLSAAAKIERDALGVPRISAANRTDAARALGFLHAQDRFFQMDLLRRRAAGELAELFGKAALPLDQSARRHGFRRTAHEVVGRLPAEQRATVDAYVAGVNAGLAALARQPWEYYVVRVDPAPWTAEDTILCIYAMWIDLQDANGHHDRNLGALQLAYGASGLAFFAPRGTQADAALDGSQFPAPDLPPLRLKNSEPATSARFSADAFEPEVLPGSNSFAVDGAHSATGSGILANDMHLGLAVPNTWYRATLDWTDATGERHQVSGVSLPGAPAIIVGSNGHIAWGFTNSYADTVDAVVVETYADSQYRTPEGWRDLEERVEVIKVKGSEPVNYSVRWTKWGPLLGPAVEGRAFALSWNAHHADAANLTLIELETARTSAEAVKIAHRAGMPNNNLLVADRDGRIAWTVTGMLPKRIGFDGRVPVSWAYGDRRWTGWLAADEVPVIANPSDGVLWTANNRIVGGDAYATLGDGGYDNGFRAGSIRDDLRARATAKPLAETDVLAVQLADRAHHLERWQKLLLATLDENAVKEKSARREMRELVAAWDGRATADSVGYRLIREFRVKVNERALAPFLARPQRSYESFRFGGMLEDSVWRLINEKPARLLNPDHRSWDELLLAAVDDVLTDAAKQGTPLAKFTWGARNTLQMKHPFSRFLPAWIGRFISMPEQPLPGDSGMARVQGPSFGASERMVVSPGHEERGIFHMPGGQSGHPLSPFFRAGHEAWVKGEPTPLLPGTAVHTLTLAPQ